VNRWSFTGASFEVTPVANLDPVGAFIANLHNLLGHDKTAAALGVPAGEKLDCILCRHDPGARYPRGSHHGAGTRRYLTRR